MNKIRKLLVLVLVALVGINLISSIATASTSDVNFVINKKPYVTPKGEPAPYVNKDYRTLVPVRFFADALGAKVGWDQASKTASVKTEAREVKVTLGDDKIYVNGKTVYMDTKAEVKQGRTFIPARFIADGLGATVRFEAATNTVNIDLDPSSVEKDKETAAVDPYGREIRTTNLPKNYGDFEYILKDIPNEMYEMEYWAGDSGGKFLTPKDFKNQFPAQFTKANIDRWVDKATNYYDLILNVDYRTIDYTWGDKVWDNMSHGVNEKYTRQQLRSYVNWVKENEIVIVGSVTPEPTIVYNSALGRHIRASIEFEIVNYKSNEDVIYDSLYKYIKDDLVKGKKYRGFFDIKLTNSVNTTDWGTYLRVSPLSSIFENPNIPGIKSAFDY